jgi:hypothetical protein
VPIGFGRSRSTLGSFKNLPTRKIASSQKLMSVANGPSNSIHNPISDH